MMVWCAVPSLAGEAKKNSSSVKPYTVVIDAGHGGKDTGAIDNNVKEKDINLGVALELGKLIESKMKDAKVVYTRNSDTYLTLQERADKANNAKGDIFISIHTNSVDKSNKNRTSVAGASVYALGLHKDKNNMDVARRENAVIELEKNFDEKYSGFDPQRDESYIIFEMAQKKNLSKSIRLAEEIQKQLVKTAGRRDRGVHQAGFWVLWATSMPAVLVELDFICNPNSAKYMASHEGQKKLASAIFKAVENHRGAARTAETKSAAPTQPEEGAVTLAAVSPAHSRTDAAPATKNARKPGSVTARRRRSASSRQASEQRDVETASIPLRSAESAPAAAATASAPAEPKIEEPDMTEASRRAAKRKAARKTKTRKERHQSKIEKFRTVYKIQILASPKQLKNNDPEFCGLTPVKWFKENNLYKYTYSETENRQEIEKTLKDVRKKIPGAFIIKAMTPL